MVSGRSWDLRVRSWAALGAYVGARGVVLGAILDVLGVWGRSWTPYGRSWAALGACLGGLGCTWAALGTFVGDLGPLLGFSWRSWAAIGAAVCDPGPLLELILTILGCSWGLSLRTAAVLRAYVGGLQLKIERHSYFENVLISRAGARCAAWGAVLGRS